MARIGVYTSDFKFYHDVIKLLKEWGLPFVSVESSESIPSDVSVILSSSKDEVKLERQVKSNDSKQALRMSLSRLLMKDAFDSLVIGIDPGPYPGLAVLADDVLTEAYECPSIDIVGGEIDSIVSSYHFNQLEIKIGDGDAPNRDLIIDSLREINLKVRVVDEKNTSFPHKIHDNALSAARIAQVEQQYLISDEQLMQNLKRKQAYEREFTTLRSLVS